MNTHIAIYYCMSLISGFEQNAQSEIEHLRQRYPEATKEASVCKAEIQAINESKSNSPIEMAYHGAYYMLWAKHLSNPLSKLNNFKKGKSLMEEAVKQHPNNPEIHFLRLTIQYHAPSILKYNNNIQQDLGVIKQHWDSIPEGMLKENMKTFLTERNLL